VPSFRRYAIGAALSNVGTWMHRVAQAWLVLAVTGEPAMLGIATGLQFLPMLLIGPFAGVLADRIDRRKLLIATQSALAVQAVLLAVAVLLGMATTGLLLTAALLLGIITAVDAPARQSIVSDLVPPKYVVNAVSLNSASFNAARLVGPALAGIMIAVWGSGWVFMINAFTFVAMLVALTGMRLPATATRTSRAAGGVVDGFRHVVSHPDLLFVILTAGLVSMFALNSQVTIAIMSTKEFHADAVVYGVLGSLMAIGSLTGSLLAARRGSTSLLIVRRSAIAVGVATLAAGLMPGTLTYGLALMACGISAITMMTAANAYLQTHAGSEHRSRVMALYLAVFFGTTPIGAPLVGWLSGALGPRAGLVIPGLLAVLTALALAAWYRTRTPTVSSDAGAAQSAPAPVVAGV
jgi:MFS family permease